MKNKKKQLIISTGFIILLILAVIGVSYAAFSYIRTGEKVNQITTGTISMNYEESSNVIHITGALPTSDETGMKRLTDGEYFDFSVSTNLNGEAVINWEIAAEDFEDNTFEGANVKFYLTRLEGDIEVPVSEELPKVYSEETEENEKTGRPAGMMSLLIGSTQTKGEEVTNYRLRLYVDENYNPQGDGGSLVFKTRINVYGKVDINEIPEKVQLPVMKQMGRYYNGEFHTYEYQERITQLKIKTDTNIPNTALTIDDGKGNYWDVSETGDDSVIAYIEEDTTSVTITEYIKDPSTGKLSSVKVDVPGYKLTIGGQGGVAANENSGFVFKSLVNVKTVDVRNLDTSNVTNMESMFQGCAASALDLRNFNTSKVTEMFEMFYNCNNLTSLDVSNFNTSNVTSMGSMFYNCNNLTSLDLSNFDTSNVTSMGKMFEKCTNLTSLDLFNFDTSNVTRMSFMFSECSSLASLDISNFNTSNVIYMGSMFYKCNSLENIDVSSFNTSKVTGMEEMFYKCTSLTSLDLTSFDVSKVNSMRWIFAYCDKLTIITVNNNWNTSRAYNYSIGDQNGTTGMFDDCGVRSVTRV